MEYEGYMVSSLKWNKYLLYGLAIALLVITVIEIKEVKAEIRGDVYVYNVTKIYNFTFPNDGNQANSFWRKQGSFANCASASTCMDGTNATQDLYKGIYDIGGGYYAQEASTGVNQKIMFRFNFTIDEAETIGNITSITIKFDNYMTEHEIKLPENFKIIPPTEYSHGKLSEEIYYENRKNIFIVEDNMDLLSYLQTSLMNKYNVFYALNGKDALVKLIYLPIPDLIISDIMMDEMDGFNFFDELVKIITSDPPVIGSLPHIHKAGKDENIDTCGICGHDIRHEIHVRL